jgi:hypothetical protein
MKVNQKQLQTDSLLMKFVESELIHSALLTLQKWTVESVSTIHGQSRFSTNLNVLDWVWPSKKKIYFIFVFNCVLFEKLVFNIIQWHYIN